MPDVMPDVTAFLGGLQARVRDDGAVVIEDGDVIVADLFNHGTLYAAEMAQALVTAAHEYAALVHCADCCFWIRVQSNEGDCTAHRVAIVSKGDCYCSWGREKDA